ncbi:MAG: NADH-dependent [FeFe] hydrogenase, group A6 [Firmicutes bacterium]|nr:NADH-dependent [FeFe] hydrogenase, group A6 [Bacillota bacterium]
MATVKLTINGQAIEAEAGTTIIDAAKANGISIPSLCYLPKIHKVGACRICVVEVEGARNLQVSCLTSVREGMAVHTNTGRVRHARRVLYELMLSDHSQDCLSCTRNQSCEFQRLGRLLGVDSTRFMGERSQYHSDASVSITRDMSKCILCRRCVTMCNEIQGTCVLGAQNRGFDSVVAPPDSLPIGSVDCAFCGQCTVVCPVGALKETSAAQKGWDALNTHGKRTVVQVAPAVRVAIAEEFGAPAGTRCTGKLAAALRRLGFDDIFDTNFAADLTIMEEGTELLHRLTDALSGKGAVLPMLTSCSPGWIKHIEHHFSEQLAHLSTCKSPHMMMGALVKSFYAAQIGQEPEDMFVVSVMPCTAKKFEIAREEMKNNGVQNVDAVLTTRELADMIKSAGIDFMAMPDEEFDNPLGMSTGAADIFGLTGGVMEAALRTVYEVVTGRPIPFKGLHITPIEGLDQVKETAITIADPLPAYKMFDGVTLRVAVTSGLAGASKLMKQVEAGESPYHFIEIMGCPGGCITGGGQPRSEDPRVRPKRLSGLYSEDESKALRKSHENPYIQALYADFLGEPCGHVSHELLHTTYTKRGIFNELTSQRFVLEGAGGKMDRKAAAAAERTDARAQADLHGREALESSKVFELEAENRRLMSELHDAQETVDILKGILSR